MDKRATGTDGITVNYGDADGGRSQTFRLIIGINAWVIIYLNLDNYDCTKLR